MRQSRCVGPPPRHHAVVLTSFCIRRCDKRFNAGKHATARPQRHPAPRPQTLSGPNQTPTTLGELCGLDARHPWSARSAMHPCSESCAVRGEKIRVPHGVAREVPRAAASSSRTGLNPKHPGPSRGAGHASRSARSVFHVRGNASRSAPVTTALKRRLPLPGVIRSRSSGSGYGLAAPRQGLRRDQVPRGDRGQAFRQPALGCCFSALQRRESRCFSGRCELLR